VCHYHDHDSSGECKCHTDLYPIRTLLRGRHPGNPASHLTEWYCRNLEPVNDQHSFGRIYSLHLYPFGRTVCHYNYHDGCGKFHCHTDLYPVGTLLRGSHPGNPAHHFAEQYHRDLESNDNQHGFSRFYGLYLHPIGRTMCNYDYHDRSGEPQCHPDLYPIGALLRGGCSGCFVTHFSEWSNRYLESFVN
jgi:hypothetical protein